MLSTAACCLLMVLSAGQPKTLFLHADDSCPKREYSALAWYKSDTLFLVAQMDYDTVYTLEHNAVAGAIAGKPMLPKAGRVSIDGNDVLRDIEGMEGFEALAFIGNRVFFAAEASRKLEEAPDAKGNWYEMFAWIISGVYDADARTIKLLDKQPVPLSHQVDNLAIEAMFVHDGNLVLMEECNSACHGMTAKAHVFSPKLEALPSVNMNAFDHRITDASAERHGKFWVINFFLPLDWRTPPCVATETAPYEHLLEMETAPDGSLVKTSREGINLRSGLAYAEDARNWEGIARMGNDGLLVITDYFPGTVLKYVPFGDGGK